MNCAQAVNTENMYVVNEKEIRMEGIHLQLI